MRARQNVILIGLARVGQVDVHSANDIVLVFSWNTLLGIEIDERWLSIVDSSRLQCTVQ